jgi:sugar phosphate isomerase/epimerase
MELKIYKSLWGMEGSLEEQFSRIKSAGYDGIEAAAQEIKEPELFKSLLKEYGFDFIALVYTEGESHADHLLEVMTNAMQYEPSKIVAHAGRDIMPYVKQIRFFVFALQVEEQFGIPIAHETHRRRPFFSPMNTLAILKELPELKLNIDYSHWCCVTESMLQDHVQAIDLSAKHAIHLHGRVGFENGPQVPDPRVDEWSSHVKHHEEWWDKVIAAHKARDESTFTFTPEYGPPSYMHTLPASGNPVADLWDVCLWTAERFRKQFADHS